MSRHCPTCTCDLHPKPALALSWAGHWWIERRVAVAMMLDHLRGRDGRGEYHEWDKKALAYASQMRYRQVANGLVRLVRGGWVDHVRRGRYRLTPWAVELMRTIVRPRGVLRNYDQTERTRHAP